MFDSATSADRDITPVSPPVISVHRMNAHVIKVACSNCNLRELCMPVGLNEQELQRIEDAEVCVMPFDRIEELSREVTALQRHVHKIMSREIVREHGVMLLLGSMRAEERLAAFLLNLVQRLNARGFSRSELVLRMTREEIGSYLGLKLETVSRTFSRFVEEGVAEVKQRHVRILDTDALRRIVNSQSRLIHG